MSKGLPAVGYRFFLQYIALNEPKLVAVDANKYAALLKSYQNRSNIGLSILWAVGNVGINDFQSGLTGKYINSLLLIMAHIMLPNSLQILNLAFPSLKQRYHIEDFQC